MLNLWGPQTQTYGNQHSHLQMHIALLKDCWSSVIPVAVIHKPLLRQNPHSSLSYNTDMEKEVFSRVDYLMASIQGSEGFSQFGDELGIIVGAWDALGVHFIFA